MEKSRTYNSIVNSAFGIGASAITIILNFFVRIVLVHQLGAEINGLHTLFQSIISIMALMELGISSAMVIHLYEPVKTGDQVLIKGIMAFYRKIYQIIAIAFGSLTLFVAMFLLKNIVTTTIDINLVRLYFIVFGMASVCNYLTYYKRSILFAEQKNRVSIGVTALCEIFFRGAQILFLILVKQYLLFLMLWVFEKVFANLICNHYVNKNHPYLRNNREILSKEKKDAIFKTVKPLVVNQVAGTVRQSAKSILSSMLLGNVRIVGFYGNYQLVISMVEMIFSQFGGAITSSFGNLAVDGSKERMRSAYRRASFLMDWVACYMCAGFYVCIQDFIELFFSSESVLDSISVISLLANMIFYLITIPIISIQNAMGLHRLDAVSMVIQAISSIALAYIGGLMWDMPGIFFGILIPLVIFTFIRKGIIISAFAMDMTCYEYLKFVLWELLKIVISVVITALLCSLISLDYPIMNILVKGMMAVILCSLITPLLSLRSKELSSIFHMISSYLSNRRKNNHNS